MSSWTGSTRRGTSISVSETSVSHAPDARRVDVEAELAGGLPQFSIIGLGDRGFARVIVPRENGAEASVIEGIEVIAADSIRTVVEVLEGRQPPPAIVPSRLGATPARSQLDLRDVRGQIVARRAIEIAAAGQHNLLLVGPPGSGKSMLSQRLPTILPDMTPDERLEVTKVWSAAGLTVDAGGLVTAPPFRAPHHTMSGAALIGGGSQVRPGEVSLAHRGVLFLDEMPEFPRGLLESLRQPLEDQVVTVARARHVVQLPASFILVGAANPCPCGWYGHEDDRCTCSPRLIDRYAARLSGALIDRIDLIVEAPAIAPRQLLADGYGESSQAVRARVLAARNLAFNRCGQSNARLEGRRLRETAALSPAARSLLEKAIEVRCLSARVLDRTMRVSRTIADLDRSATVGEPHVAEALQYRPRGGWGSRD